MGLNRNPFDLNLTISDVEAADLICAIGVTTHHLPACGQLFDGILKQIEDQVLAHSGFSTMDELRDAMVHEHEARAKAPLN